MPCRFHQGVPFTALLMWLFYTCFIIFCKSYKNTFFPSETAMSQPRYLKLDEVDQELYRTAYDTPSYQDDCEDDNDLQLGKVDLIKDGTWALKVKMNQLKAFNKALVANLLTTQLKLKELVMDKIAAKKYTVLEKKKHQVYEPQYAQLAAIPYAYDPYLGL